MAATLVLYFSAEAAVLYGWRRRGLHLEARFTPGDAGLAEFGEFLQRRGTTLLHVVADLAGEDFHEEQIPFLRGAERRIVIERRLSQRTRDTRLAAALSLGYAADERRNEKLLLASFTHTEPLTAWLDVVKETKATLAGMYSPGLIAPALAARLGSASGNSFLVSVNSAGLRQCFLDGGRMRFSRLERIPEDGVSPAFVRGETERMLQYLETSRTLAHDAPPMQVLVLVPDAEQQRFDASLLSEPRLTFKTIGIAEAAGRLGLRHVPQSAAADLLYVYLAAGWPPKEQFVRGADRRPFLLRRLRRAILAAGASGLAACTAYAGTLWLEDRAARRDVGSLRQELAQMRAQEQRLRARFPAMPTSAENLKATALEFRRIAARTAAPEAALIHVSRALDQAPEIELDALSWEMTDSMFPTLEISGRVRSPGPSNYRELGEKVQRFANLLASDPQWRVASTRLPFDAAPQSALAGDFGARHADEPPRFSLTLARTSR